MPLQLILHCTLTDEAAFQALAQDFPLHVEANEPGTIDYRWQRENGGDRVVFLDGYATPDDFVHHFTQAVEAGYVDRLMASCRIDSVHAFGDVNDAALGILGQFGAVRYDQVAGFTRA